MKLSLYNDSSAADTTRLAERFQHEHVLDRLRALDARVREAGTSGLSASDDPLVSIGMEIDAHGRVTRNCYGVFSLAWQAAQHPEWSGQIAEEIEDVRGRMRDAHGVPLRFLIWAGMGGSVEDKTMFNGAGLLGAGVTCYSLDSTDPAKLQAILGDIERRARRPLRDALRSTLVVGMALGMTSYEPVVNLEKLSALYDQLGIDSRSNFLYLTLPGSLLDQFAGPRGYRQVALQMDGGHTTAGRHSGPLTRGSLYPLALGGADLDRWLRGTALDERDIATAWKLAAFLHANGIRGRDKVTLMLPRAWQAAALWTKQDFEESLGKSEDLGIKIVVDERPRASCWRRPEDPRQDRVFLAFRLRPGLPPAAIATLRRAGYPVAVVDLPSRTSLSRYMQFVHYAVFGIAYLREMNFVTQPNVELYKTIAGEIYSESKQAGAATRTSAWRSMSESTRQATWRRRLTLFYDGIDDQAAGDDAVKVYASMLARLFDSRAAEYGELTYFGDLRYSEQGRAMRALLRDAADTVFRRTLRVPVDVYEGPAMNHSYHEMIIGHGHGFSTVLLSRKQASIPRIGYTSEYHVAQFLATRLALVRRHRPVAAILLEDLTAASRRVAERFFAAVASQLKKMERAA